MAATHAGVWGIDLGQCALKAIRLEKIGDDITATAFDYIEYPKILSQPDADPDQLLREALETFLSRNKLRGDQVAISVPGQSGLARFVKLPPVEEKKIADIVKFEAKQQIPFPLDEVVWAFQKINKSEVTDGFAMDTEIGLFALKRDIVNRYIQHFKDVNIEVHYVQMAPLSLVNFLAYDILEKDVDGEGGEETEEKQCVVALDIGTDNSNMVITDGARILWQRPIPIGGNHFTRALTKDMKLTFAKAEHLKRNAVKSPDLKKILSSLKQVLNDFVGEVQRSLGYFTNTHRDATVQYVVGLGNAFRLPGLQKYLQEKLQLEVRKLTSLRRVTGDEVTQAPTFNDNILSFSVAYGLALQGLKVARVQTNLLPSELIRERMIRAKKPAAVAAAACLLLGIAGLTFGRSVERAQVFDPQIEVAKTAAKAQENRRQAVLNKMNDLKKKIEQSRDNIRMLGSGVDERYNWQLLHQYINLALPLPNGDRVPVVNSRNYAARKQFVTKDAIKAYELMEQQRFAKVKPNLNDVNALKIEEFIKKNLIQVNIEAIASMYTDDLPSYFKRIHEYKPILTGMDPLEADQVVTWSKKGEKKAIKVRGEDRPFPEQGWIIEIRGYTYHEKGRSFVDETFLDNLNYPRNNAETFKFLSEDPLGQEMDSRVRKRISHFLILEEREVPQPKPGVFQILHQLHLPLHVKSEQPKEVVRDRTAGEGGLRGNSEEKSDGPVRKNRDGWEMIGEAQGKRAEKGGFGAQDGKKDEKVAAAVIPAKRTEFVMLFVWQEPILESTTAAAGNASGANPAGTRPPPDQLMP